MSRFYPMLEEGSIHVLSKFRVIHSFGTYRATRNKFMISFCRQTQICILQDYGILIPKYKFHYTAFSDLPSLSTNKTYLTDIVGIVKEIYPLELTANGQKSCPRRSLKLIDESNAELKATLWNKLAVELESKLQNQDPNNMVMIVTGVVINTFRGQFSASASTGSKVYINIEDTRVLELSHRHTDSETELQVIATPVYFSPSQTNLMKFEITTLMELIYFEDPKTAEVYHFLCQVKIIGILEQKWRYHGCPYCNKKTMESGNTYWCRQCNREVLAENKYRITLDVEDRTTVSTFVVFGKEAENLIKVSAQEVSRTIEYNNEREIFLEIIKSIIGKTIKVQVKLTKYNFEEGNESFIVTKLIEAIEGSAASSNPCMPTSLSLHLRSGSIKGGQSPMFPTTDIISIGDGRKKGDTFEAAEPSFPKVTCIDQIRVKSKKKRSKAMTKSKLVSRSRSGRGEASFRRSEAVSRRWKTVSVCDALGSFG
ncbi:uncharacterized protein A4U43_C07F32610 [Asparagus officinalis]|uniref:Replication factor A C-terminal domain-containing protein n=1 Tax=Asparagus officinalis TaxID=4686 RepID=A0A5P1EIJ4_ASPOF|nr:uncharacterized protein A4U43_C07F32610 [Asparagus officinalis]